MTDTPKPLSEQEIASLRQSVVMMLRQLEAGRFDESYTQRQLTKIHDVLDRMQEGVKQQQHAARFEALYNVTRILGNSLDLQIVLDQVMDAIIQLTGAERGFLMLRDDDGNLTVQTARNLDQKTLSSSEFEYSRTISNMVLDSGDAVLTSNAIQDPRFMNQKSVMTGTLRSIMAVPMRARGSVIGIAYVENRINEGVFNDDDLTTLETLVAQASIAIDNAILFAETDEALSRRLEELRSLRRIDLQLNQKLEPDEAMLYTLEMACRIGGAAEGYLGLVRVDGEARYINATHHFLASREEAQLDQAIDLEAAYPRIWEVVDQKQTLIFDTGQYSLMTIMMTPILRDDNVIGVVLLKRNDGGAFTDEQRDLVERVVARAAINIENARLYADVRAADRAKTEFVGIVAHDLKAPMTSIRGYADLMAMQSSNLTERQTRFLARISNTVKRMEMLVSDLADISRIESGEFLMAEMRVTVDSVLEAVRDTIMPQVEEREHTFNLDVEAHLPDMWTDYYRLVQVLTNLLSNAYKYTPTGGTITLTVKRHNDRIHFAVTDNGIGLSSTQIVQLGTKFWRAEDEYTRSQPGTGLGFAITKSLVTQMDSIITIESTVGVGSTFAFDIAIANETQVAQMPQASESE